MTAAGLVVRRAGPGLGLQDEGRSGFMSYGVSSGGAMDHIALAEARCLAGADSGPAIEIGPGGASFACVGDAITISLTGVPMRAAASGRPLEWGAAHKILAGDDLDISSQTGGGYGYLCLGGGILAATVLGSASVHFASAIGTPLVEGDVVAPLDPDSGLAGWRLGPREADSPDAPIRVIPSVQDHLFTQAEKMRFQETLFRKSHRANRVGMALDFEGAGFQADAHLSITSDIVVPGDVQLVGDGRPYVLFAECQTTGGYPRIATVIAADVPRLAQMPPGHSFSMVYIDHDEALEARRNMVRDIKGIPTRLEPAVRDPRDIADLLSYQLVSGAISGGDE
jgi:allophanate hydrolase